MARGSVSSLSTTSATATGSTSGTTRLWRKSSRSTTSSSSSRNNGSSRRWSLSSVGTIQNFLSSSLHGLVVRSPVRRVTKQAKNNGSDDLSGTDGIRRAPLVYKKISDAESSNFVTTCSNEKDELYIAREKGQLEQSILEQYPSLRSIGDGSIELDSKSATATVTATEAKSSSSSTNIVDDRERSKEYIQTKDSKEYHYVKQINELKFDLNELKTTINGYKDENEELLYDAQILGDENEYLSNELHVCQTTLNKCQEQKQILSVGLEKANYEVERLEELLLQEKTKSKAMKSILMNDRSSSSSINTCEHRSNSSRTVHSMEHPDRESTIYSNAIPPSSASSPRRLFLPRANSCRGGNLSGNKIHSAKKSRRSRKLQSSYSPTADTTDEQQQQHSKLCSIDWHEEDLQLMINGLQSELVRKTREWNNEKYRMQEEVMKTRKQMTKSEDIAQCAIEAQMRSKCTIERLMKLINNCNDCRIENDMYVNQIEQTQRQLDEFRKRSGYSCVEEVTDDKKKKNDKDCCSSGNTVISFLSRPSPSTTAAGCDDDISEPILQLPSPKSTRIKNKKESGQENTVKVFAANSESNNTNSCYPSRIGASVGMTSTTTTLPSSDIAWSPSACYRKARQRLLLSPPQVSSYSKDERRDEATNIDGANGGKNTTVVVPEFKLPDIAKDKYCYRYERSHKEDDVDDNFSCDMNSRMDGSLYVDFPSPNTGITKSAANAEHKSITTSCLLEIPSIKEDITTPRNMSTLKSETDSYHVEHASCLPPRLLFDSRDDEHNCECSFANSDERDVETVIL